MTRYQDCKCNGCQVRIFIKKGTEQKCPHCGNTDLTVTGEFLKDLKIGESEPFLEVATVLPENGESENCARERLERIL